MRALLVFVIALTFCLARASPRIEEHPESRSSKELGKGRSLESDEQHKQDDGRLNDDEDERKEPDEHRMKDDEPEIEGRVKETSVRRKHFTDQYYLQSGPTKYEFGHVCEDPDDWEHRYEKRDYDKNSHQGQVKWGDANGGQGEQLWDFNHGGKDSGEDEEEEEQKEERSKEHRFQKPRKKIQIKEKIVETKTDDKGKSEFRRSKTGSTVYSGDKKEEGKYEEVVTKTKKKNNDIPFLFDPIMFDSVETPRGFSKLDFDFDDHEHDHDFDHDFDIDRMGTFGPEMKDDFIPVHLRSFYTGRMGHTDSIAEKSSINHDSENPENRKGYFTIKEQIRRIDTGAPAKDGITEGNKKKISIEEHQQFRRYGFFPTPLLKRSISSFNVGVATGTKDKDLSSAGTEDVDMKELKIDSGSPITGSLTEQATGKVFKIYGVLVDS